MPEVDDRDDWEEETPEARRIRRGSFDSLLHLPDEQKSVREQAKLLVANTRELEELILENKALPPPEGDGAEEAIIQADRRLERMRVVNAGLMDRLELIQAGHDLGWDVVQVYEDQNKTVTRSLPAPWWRPRRLGSRPGRPSEVGRPP